MMAERAGKRFLAAVLLTVLPLASAYGSDAGLQRTRGWPYAGARAVAVDADRDLVYLGSGGVVLVLDVSDPAHPQLVYDGLHTDGHVRDLRYDASNQLLYVADWRGGLETWDVRDPHNPSRLSGVPVYWVGTQAEYPIDRVFLSGDFVYVNAGDARVHGFNVSNAANPVDIGIQAGPFYYYDYDRDTSDVAVADGNAYVAGNGLAKYHIQSDGTLSKVGEDTYDDGVTCIEARGSYVFAGVSQSLGVFDVSASNPYLAGTAPLSHTLYDVALTGNSVVAVDGADLLIFDVSAPQQPQQIASLPLPTSYRVRLDGDIAYVSSDDDGLQVVDISDVHNPVLIGNYDTVGTTWRVTVAGNHAFLSQGTEGLVITDVSSPNAVTPIGKFEGGAANESVLVGHYLYVSDWYAQALRVLDVSDLTHPLEVGRVDNFYSTYLATDGEHLYVLRFSVDTQLFYLHIFDLSDPTSPVELSTMTLGHYIFDLEYANGHLFALEFYDAGIHIINVTNPNSPFEDAFYPVDWGEDVSIQGNYAYVTAFHEGLLVLDIADPAHPTLAGNFYEIYQFDSVAVSGNLAFITTGTTGEQHLRLYDVGNLDNIHELDRVSLPGNAWALTAQGSSAYVADGITGLQILRAGDDNSLIFADDFELGTMSKWSTAR